MLLISGRRSKIAACIERIVSDEVRDLVQCRGEPQELGARYLLCDGHLDGERWPEDRGAEAWEANFAMVVEECEVVLDFDPAARICVLGSMSGVRGSFDLAYAGSKAALHQYVRNRTLMPRQQLVAIAPNVIWDAGMTERRMRNPADAARLIRRQAAHPKGRFTTCAEVAALAYFLLYVDSGYITNTVIEMHGGER